MLTMLILYLLAIQFVQSNGDLTCLVFTYSTCYGMIGVDHDFCTDAPQVIECLKENTQTCEVENAVNVAGIEDSLSGHEALNSEFCFNKACYYNVYLSDTFQSCFANVDSAFSTSQGTGSEEAKNLPIIEFGCRYNDSMINCSERTVGLVCGNDTIDIYNKKLPPKEDFVQRFCETNRAADFRLSWISLLLQTSTVIFVYKLSNFYARVTML